jgi:methylenetetrahydrofolate reductase (NADPH)
MGLDKKVFLLIGVGPIASAKAARWMRSNVPGIHIPDHVIERVEKAQKPAEEGKRICIELIQQIREIKGVAGIHVMAYRREHLVSEIILESGVLKGRASSGGRRRRTGPGAAQP